MMFAFNLLLVDGEGACSFTRRMQFEAVAHVATQVDRVFSCSLFFSSLISLPSDFAFFRKVLETNVASAWSKFQLFFIFPTLKARAIKTRLLTAP